MASPKIYGGEQGHDSVHPLCDTFPTLGVFFDCVAPFAANGQVWGPRTHASCHLLHASEGGMDESKEGSYRREGCAARKGRDLVTLLSIFQTLEPPSHDQSNKTRAINPVGKTAGVQRV